MQFREVQDVIYVLQHDKFDLLPDASQSHIACQTS